jgi:NADH dehydrogenase
MRSGRRHVDCSAPRVVVAGAGFGGLATLRTLSRAGFRVTLVDRNPYSTFQPLLYQVATAGLAPSDVAYPVRTVTRKYRASFRHGELSRIDTTARRAELADGTRLDYDYLVLATGVAASYYGITGAAEHTYGLYTRRDAVALAGRILAGVEELSQPGAPDSAVITVVGGGATGVELAGSLAELRNIALAASYPEIDPRRVQIRLVEMAPHLLAPFRASLREYARRQLAARGVDLRLSTAIREVTGDAIVLDSGEKLRSDLTVWAAGVSAPPAAAQWGLPQGPGGRITVGGDLRVTGQQRIFAVGDIALSPEPLAQLAQPALQMGRHAAEQIVRLEAGQPTVPFRYHNKGIMATIGRKSAVVQLAHGARFRGSIAWLMWLVLHLLYLLGARNRLSALLNLSWRYLTWAHGGGLIIGDDTLAAPENAPAADQAAPRRP